MWLLGLFYLNTFAYWWSGVQEDCCSGDQWFANEGVHIPNAAVCGNHETQLSSFIKPNSDPQNEVTTLASLECFPMQENGEG